MSPLRGPGSSTPAGGACAPEAEYLGGGFRASRAPSGGPWTTCEQVAHRLTCGFRFARPRALPPHGLTDSFSPGSLPPLDWAAVGSRPERSGRGGAQPPGPGAAGPAVWGRRARSGGTYACVSRLKNAPLDHREGRGSESFEINGLRRYPRKHCFGVRKIAFPGSAENMRRRAIFVRTKLER